MQRLEERGGLRRRVNVEFDRLLVGAGLSVAPMADVTGVSGYNLGVVCH